MLEYKTTGIVKVNSGYIGLDRKQADARKPYIKPAKEDGEYEVLQPIMFKAGEVIRMGNPDKFSLQSLELTEKSKAAQKPVEPEPVKAEPVKPAPAKKYTPKKVAKKK